jgi:flagellar biogenesis protein FliO
MVEMLIIIAIVALCAFVLHRIGSPYAGENHPRHA